MKKQLIMTVSAAFQAFVQRTCENNVGPAKSKEDGKALTQAELSDAILDFVNQQHYVEVSEIDPSSGEETFVMVPVSLEDSINVVLSSRDVSHGTREGARAKLSAAEAKLMDQLKAIQACKDMLKSMGKTDDEIASFLEAQGLKV